MAFRLIPPGEFRMGSRGFWDSEEPAQRVKIARPFWLAETPVTQAQFGLWTTSAGTKHKNGFPGNPNHPAETLDWRQANEYCAWLAKNQAGKLPKGFSLACLPTEAEWEYACRARTDTEYYTGDGEAALEQAGWFDGNSKNSTRAVGQKDANAFQLHDMHGNVWEWCHDIWDDTPYRKRLNGVVDPGANEREEEWRGGLEKILESKEVRALRGGSWYFSARYCRSALRSRLRPDDLGRILGFRVCLVPGPSAQPAIRAAERPSRRRKTEDEGRGRSRESPAAREKSEIA
jgi:formylglycine-generating enzyme required for sulfatase activity